MRYLLFACVCVAVSAALPLAAAAGERGAIACKKGERAKACKKAQKPNSAISPEEWERNERALQLNVIQSLQGRR